MYISENVVKILTPRDSLTKRKPTTLAIKNPCQDDWQGQCSFLWNL